MTLHADPAGGAAAPDRAVPASAPAVSLPARLRAHAAALLRLAWPVMLSRAGILLFTIADIAMVGRASLEAVAALGLSFAVFVPLTVTGVGLTMGVVSVASRRFGAGDGRGAAETWARGLHFAAVLGALGWAICLLAEPILLLLGQSPALAAPAAEAAIAQAPGLPALMLFMVSAFYLESSGRALPALVVMALGNAGNLALNALWILPGAEATGAAWATTTMRWAMALALAAWCLRDERVRALGRAALRPWGPGGWAAGREMRAIGVSAGASGFFETSAFAAMALIAGVAGAVPLGAYSVAHSVESVIFMSAMGLATAAGVRVGAQAGAGRRGEAALAGWTGLGVAMGLTGALCALMLIFRRDIAGFYSEDPAVIARVSAAFLVIAASLIFDAGQAVMGQCVRALGDTWAAAAIFFFAFFCVMVPLGWTLALHAGMEETGLFIATLAGCATAVIGLGLRFAALTRRREGAA